VPPAVRLAAIGWRARAALGATGGAARVLASLTASTYLDAGGVLLWMGRADSPRHPRAALTNAALPAPNSSLTLDFAGLEPWRPRQAAARDAISLRRGALGLLDALGRREVTGTRPVGLGVLLEGQPLPFPLARAADAVRVMADACQRDDASAAFAAGDRLLGLGPGLTPSGDDFVGGVLFARHMLQPADPGWSGAAAELVERARTRTHPVSAALLTDLARGEGHEPLHDVVDALAHGDALDRASRPVAQLARLGHSSGWDLLTGVLVGLTGAALLDRWSSGR
jgi:hypothetical protein